MMLDKWGIAQLDFLPCYFSIKKIWSVKSFSEIRWRVLLGERIPKAYLISKMILSQEVSQESVPWRVNRLFALCFDGLVAQWRLPYLYLLGSPEFKGPSPACLWFTSINAVFPSPSALAGASTVCLFVCTCCSHCVPWLCVYVYVHKISQFEEQNLAGVLLLPGTLQHWPISIFFWPTRNTISICQVPSSVPGLMLQANFTKIKKKR